MNADEAFDNLMNRQALAIPVADRAQRQSTDEVGIDDAQGADDENVMVLDPVDEIEGQEDYQEPYDDEEVSTRIIPRSAEEAASGQASDRSMKVEELLDEGAFTDYSPHQSESTRTYAENNTDTDLPTLDTQELLDAAEAQTPEAKRDRLRGTADSRDITVEVDDVDELQSTGRNPGQNGLGLARRIKRFGYLPLEGMDAFNAEARDMISRLTALAPDKPSIAITSSRRREGRTELALRLALAMSRKVDFRVLLADFDVREPAVAARLGLSTSHFTVMDVLRGSCPLGEALFWGEEENLYVLPARATDREGDEILESRQIAALMERIHETFDFAVFDCGPAGHADAMAICMAAGSVAIAGRTGYSLSSEMSLTAEALRTAGANVAGLLITG